MLDSAFHFSTELGSVAIRTNLLDLFHAQKQPVYASTLEARRGCE